MILFSSLCLALGRGAATGNDLHLLDVSLLTVPDLEHLTLSAWPSVPHFSRVPDLQYLTFPESTLAQSKVWQVAISIVKKITSLSFLISLQLKFLFIVCPFLSALFPTCVLLITHLAWLYTRGTITFFSFSLFKSRHPSHYSLTTVLLFFCILLYIVLCVANEYHVLQSLEFFNHV